MGWKERAQEPMMSNGIHNMHMEGKLFRLVGGWGARLRQRQGICSILEVLSVNLQPWGALKPVQVS
eukprot:1392731-Amorphochlora_amoeboformis.AAC.1